MSWQRMPQKRSSIWAHYSLRKSTNVKNSYADLFLYVGEINNERIFFREITASGNQWNTFAP